MKRAKRILAIMLATIMVFGAIPATAFATEVSEAVPVDGSVSEEVIMTSEEQETESTVEDVSEGVLEDASEQEEEPAGEETSEPAAETGETEEQVTESVPEETVEGPVTLTVDGNDYTVTATFDAASGLPAGVQMKVSEIKENGEDAKQYENLCDQTLEAVQKDTETEVKLTYARFFDITFYTEAGEVEPTGPVSVNIKYNDAIDVENKDAVSVYHFDDQKEEVRAMDIETAGSGDSVDEISFETNGFSIYAVVGTTDVINESRMTLNFYRRNSENNEPGTEDDTLIATVYVKNGDNSVEDLEKIIYDPGAGDLEPGQLFKGWIEKEDYTVKDVDSKKSIADIRNWAKDRGDITENEEHNFYAMVYKTFSVAYKDEDGITLRSDALISDGDSVDYTIYYYYTPADQDEVFLGWYAAPEENVTPVNPLAPYPYENNTEVTITGNAVLSVYAPKGHWLNFEGNGKGARYTRPQFIAMNDDGSEGVTVEPEDPTRNGYTFDGWYTGEPEKEGEDPTGEKFTFGNTLGANTTLYAKWNKEPSANYSVIIWKQRADDDKDAADADKKYDVAEVIQKTGTPGASASSIVTQDGSRVYTGRGNNERVRNYIVDGSEKAYTGFHAGRYDTNVTIDPEGTTVLNVYYDRNLITINFNAGSSGLANRYIFDSVAKEYVNSVSYAGLYNSELSFTWPTQYYYYDWWSDSYVLDGSTLWLYGTNGLTFLGAFKLPTESDVSINLTRFSPGRTPVRFIRQKADGSWPQINETDYVLEVNVNNSVPFTVTNKYAGFTAYQYKKGDYTTSDSGWTAIEADQSVSDFNALNIRFKRSTYEINYLDGTYFNGDGAILQQATKTPLHMVDGIYYQASLDSYNKVDKDNKPGSNYYEPDPKDGYVFAGWYVDPTCTKEYTFETMPENGITVYAKWVQKQYRVFLHPNVPSDEFTFSMGNQATSFLMDYDQKISNGYPIQAKRDNYELIGWYYDEAFRNAFNFDLYRVNDTNVPTPYDTTNDGKYNPTDPTERDEFGNVISGQENVNMDADNNRTWVLSKLDLYAKWRSTLEGAKGINIIYDAGEEGVPESAPTDSLQYLDNSEANAGAASTPTDPTKQFKYWIVQKWNGTEYEDIEGEIVYPGDVFTVLKANAKAVVTKWVNPDNNADVITVVDPKPGTTPPDNTHTKIKTASYTVSLRAVYGDKDAPTPTHITWYANNGTGASVTSENLQINEAVNVLKPGGKITYEGHKFLGWARMTEVSGTDGTVTTIGGANPANLALELGESDLFLKWDAETGKFLATAKTGSGYAAGDEVTQIAADEKNPYHGMVAVWAAQYGVYHSSTEETVWYDWPAYNVNLTGMVTDGFLYGGYYEYDEGSTTHKGTAITKEPGTDMTPEKGKVYYLKEVDGNYLRPNVYLVYSRIHNGLIRDLYGFVNVDSIDDYPERGLIVDGVDNRIDKDSMVSESIVVIRDGQTYATLTPLGLFKQEEAYFGYTSLTGKISGNATVTITGYYITKDNIKVTGYKDRIIRFAADDSRYGAPVFTGWGSGEGQTLCGLKSRQQTNVPVSGRALSAAGMLSVRRTLTLMAPSDQLEYTITKVYETGTEEQKVQEGNHTGEVSYSPKDGYLFAGWYKDQAFTEPADFSNVQSDMTVYARFVNKNDISLTLSRKSQKSGKTTFNAVVTVKNKMDLENVAINADGTDTVLSDGTVKKTGSGKYMRYTTRYNGAVTVYGLSMFDSFTTSVSWTTPDGTVVTGPAWKCTYFLGMVSVQ